MNAVCLDYSLIHGKAFLSRADVYKQQVLLGRKRKIDENEGATSCHGVPSEGIVKGVSNRYPFRVMVVYLSSLLKIVLP